MAPIAPHWQSGTWARGLPSIDQGLDPPNPVCQCITSSYWFQGYRLLVQSVLDSFTSDFPLAFRDVHSLSQRAMRLNVKPPSSRHVSELNQLMVRTQRLDHTAVVFSDVPGSYTTRHAVSHRTY
jgi:hypothetical protein